MQIDLVIPYVDGSDPQWIEQHNRFLGVGQGESNTPNRYRSMDNLHYVFRSVEKNMGFINKVFLLVSGESQVPWWVDRSTVNVVLHKDFIPNEYLPTFNCNTIEMFLHRIPGLSEHFIYSNDDLFFLKSIKESSIFNDNKVGLAFDNISANASNADLFQHFCLNSWFTLKGTKPSGRVSLKAPNHSIHPMRKSTLEKVWKDYGDILSKSLTPIRANKNINQYIFCDREFLDGNTFTPKMTFKYHNMGNPRAVANAVRDKSCDVICINDALNTGDVFTSKKLINTELFRLFPYRSKYEKAGNKKVTVIIPCYNMSKYVTEAIDSVKAQTYKNWGCVLVDDGSTDNTYDVISKAVGNDKRFKIVRQKNQGVAEARNNAIRLSNGEYILPLDPDDKIDRTYLEKAADALDKNPSCSLVYGRYKDFGESDSIQTRVWTNYDDMLKGNSIPDTAMYRRSDFNRTKGYDKELKGYEDWEFWIRFLHKNDFVLLLDEVLLHYRVKSVSRNKNANRIRNSILYEIRKKNAGIFSESMRGKTGTSSVKYTSPVTRRVVRRVMDKRPLDNKMLGILRS